MDTLKKSMKTLKKNENIEQINKNIGKIHKNIETIHKSIRKIHKNIAKCSWFDTFKTCCGSGKTIMPWFVAFIMWTLQNVHVFYMSETMFLTMMQLAFQWVWHVDACTNYWIYAKIIGVTLVKNVVVTFCVWWCAAFHWGKLSPHNVDGTSSVRANLRTCIKRRQFAIDLRSIRHRSSPCLLPTMGPTHCR